MHISSPMVGGSICNKDQFELTCWYPEVTAPGRYLVPTPGWKVNGSVLTLDGTTYRAERINATATKLIVTVTDSFSVNTDVAYSCFLVLADSRLDESSQQVHVHIMGWWYVSAYQCWAKWRQKFNLYSTSCILLCLSYHLFTYVHMQPFPTLLSSLT